VIHIRDVLGVVLDREVHKSDLQLEQFVNLNGLALLINDLIRVFLDKLEDL
jgi:hypothetical protein